MYICEKLQAAPDILRVPLDLAVRSGNVQFARPIFNLNGTRVTGSELGPGTVDAGGKIHVTSEWAFRRVAFQGDYSGTLIPSGGTLTGTQSWRGPGSVVAAPARRPSCRCLGSSTPPSSHKRFQRL